MPRTANMAEYRGDCVDFRGHARADDRDWVVGGGQNSRAFGSALVSGGQNSSAFGSALVGGGQMNAARGFAVVSGGQPSAASGHLPLLGGRADVSVSPRDWVPPYDVKEMLDTLKRLCKDADHLLKTDADPGAGNNMHNALVLVRELERRSNVGRSTKPARA